MFTITRHARDRMIRRGIDEGLVKLAIQHGETVLQESYSFLRKVKVGDSTLTVALRREKPGRFAVLTTWWTGDRDNEAIA